MTRKQEGSLSTTMYTLEKENPGGKQTQKQNNKDFQIAADPREEGDTKSLSCGFLRDVTLSSEQ